MHAAEQVSLYVDLPQKCQQYTEVAIKSSLPPHIYAISDAAYQNMRRNAMSQCCVVSGESGAGLCHYGFIVSSCN